MQNRTIRLTETVSIVVKLEMEKEIDIYTARAEADLIQKICNVVEKVDNQVAQITGGIPVDDFSLDRNIKHTKQHRKNTVKTINKEEFIKDCEEAKSSGDANWKRKIAYKYGFEESSISNKYNYCKDAIKMPQYKNSSKEDKEIVPKFSKPIREKRDLSKPQTRLTWNEEDTKKLIKEYNKGTSRDKIAEMFNKTDTQIYDKLHGLKKSGKLPR